LNIYVTVPSVTYTRYTMEDKPLGIIRIGLW